MKRQKLQVVYPAAEVATYSFMFKKQSEYNTMKK